MRYKNISNGILAICDIDRKRYEVKPGEEIELERIIPKGDGLMAIEERDELTKPRKIKKIKTIKEEIENDDNIS